MIKKKKGSLVLLIFAIISLLISLYFFYTYNSTHSSALNNAIREAKNDMQKASENLDKELYKIMELADDIAFKISDDKLDSLEILNLLENSVKKYPEVFGVGIGYDKYEFSESRELYAPYYIKPEDKEFLTFVDTSYDYTTRDWYLIPKKNGAEWFEPPYYGIVAENFIAEYSVPILRNDSAIGIVYIDISFDKLIDIINKVSVGKSGYGFLLSKTGNYIVHPISEWVKSEKNIRDFAKEINNTKIIDLLENKNNREFINISNPLNGLNSTLMFQNLKATGWNFGIMFLTDDFLTNRVELFRMLILGIVFATLFFILIILFILFSVKRNKKRYWYSVATISFILSLSIWALWFLKMREPYQTQEKQSNYLITDKSVLDKFLQHQDSIFKLKHEVVPERIPTGFFIQHIEFLDANTMRLSGYIWKKFNSSVVNSSNIVPFFPEVSPDAEALELNELYRKTNDDEVTIGWFFRVAIRQKIDFKAYPFDRQMVTLRIKESDMNSNVKLIPDLESYAISNPALLPGIDDNLVLRGWNPKASFFNYEMKKYNTTFGVSSTLADRSRTELRFNVVVERKFLGPFVTHFIPLIVISIFLFTVVMSTSDKSKDEKIGFSGFGVLEISAAFYFVVILAHIDFRNFLGVQQVIYLDYFYFLVYIKILVYAVNNVLYYKYTSSKFIQEQNNLYPRLLYWPVYLGLIFIITSYVFY